MGVSVAVVENLATIIGDESHTVETWTGDRFFFSAFFFLVDYFSIIREQGFRVQGLYSKVLPTFRLQCF